LRPERQFPSTRSPRTTFSAAYPRIRVRSRCEEPGRTASNPAALTQLDMWRTCTDPEFMAKMIQIRNVPDALHKKLKVRAAQRGMSLSEYLLAEIAQVAAMPTQEEMRERLRSRSEVKLSKSAAAMLRRERDSA
jgi:plasmid stability protein